MIDLIRSDDTSREWPEGHVMAFYRIELDKPAGYQGRNSNV